MARKKLEEAPTGSPAWMNTFADLMNLLLCFFVLLFSMSSVDSVKYEELVTSFSSNFSIFDSGGTGISDGQIISNGTSQLYDLNNYTTNMESTGESDTTNESDVLQEYEQQQEKLTQQMYDEISQKVDENKIGDYVELSSNSPYVKISLNGAILFDSGKADIKTGAIPILSRIGDILKSYDEYQIEIEGHTDNVPIHNSNYKNNLRLSTDRACNVLEYFINSKNLSPKNLTSSGRAEYDPIASNKTEKGRSKNRRVEIKIYNSLSNK